MGEKIPGYSREEYERAERDLENTRGDKKQVEDYYAEELKPHHELRKEDEGAYLFDEELTQLEKGRADELRPILEREAALSAKLKRLYSLAWNEATRESRERENVKTLEALREMDKEIERIEEQLENLPETPLRRAALARISDICDLLLSLKDLLESDTPEAAQIQDKLLTLAGAYGNLTRFEHRLLWQTSPED